MIKAVSRGRVWLTLLLAAGVLGWVLWKSGQAPVGRAERVGFQDADAPLMLPSDGQVDERFYFPSAWQRAQVPQAARFGPPLGTEQGGLTYNAQKFRDMNAARGGQHLGDDLNGIGGMNTDLGDPVFAPADGLVVYAGDPSPGWGNIVVLAHKTPDGKMLQSMLAHLDRIEVLPGALVARGTRVGTVGTAHDSYPAHLHFEMRASDAVDIGGGYALQPLNRLDPAATLAALGAAAPAECAPSVLARMLLPNANPWSAVETKDAKAAERLLEILGKPKSR